MDPAHIAPSQVEPAADVMALRSIPADKRDAITPVEAQVRLRRGILDAVQEYTKKHSIAAPANILDIGCSTGEPCPHGGMLGARPRCSLPSYP